MSDPETRGRKLLLVMIAVALGVSLINIGLFATRAPNHSLTDDWINFLAEEICWFTLYLGYRWMRWLLILLLAVGGTIGIFIFSYNLPRVPGDAIWILAMGSTHLTCAALLLRSPGIKAYLQKRRPHFVKSKQGRGDAH